MRAARKQELAIFASALTLGVSLVLLTWPIFAALAGD
jgi:hypothetical protein